MIPFLYIRDSGVYFASFVVPTSVECDGRARVFVAHTRLHMKVWVPHGVGHYDNGLQPSVEIVKANAGVLSLNGDGGGVDDDVIR